MWACRGGPAVPAWCRRSVGAGLAVVGGGLTRRRQAAGFRVRRRVASAGGRWREVRPRRVQAGSRPGGRGQPGGRVQALRRGEALDRQAVGGEAGRPDRRHPGQAGEGLAGGLGQQPGELGLDLGDVGLRSRGRRSCSGGSRAGLSPEQELRSYQPWRVDMTITLVAAGSRPSAFLRIWQRQPQSPHWLPTLPR
jgi:hypothetical protein